MTSDSLSAQELVNLVQRVFVPSDNDRALAIIVDLPDLQVPDKSTWKIRRDMAAGWAEELVSSKASHGLDVALFFYRNVKGNNADLPATAWRWSLGQPLPETYETIAGQLEESMDAVLSNHTLVIAPTEFSATAPLKMLAPKFGFRAATMPGFSPEMVPALKLDYTEVNRRVNFLKDILDQSIGADFVFAVDGSDEYRLHLDLRHRTGHASGGLLREPGTAGNLPSGEAYIVPYEGELPNDPTSSQGTLPVQIGDEVVLFSIEQNRATEILSRGSESQAEAERLSAEPARGNIAELGLGVLAEFGITPVGRVLLDEKLGLHLAFGRSEHFGGQVGPSDFSRPEAVIHQDHVYLPDLQPRINAALVTLELEEGSTLELIRDGEYAIDFNM